MIQVSTILSELYGSAKSVVGFRQPYNTTYAILTGANLVSASGIYLADGIVTIENIKNCQEYADISDANFNTQLGQFIQDAIIDFCNLVFNGNDQLEKGLIFNHENIKTETLDNDGDFVGFEINVLRKEDITCLLNNLICEFNAAGTLNIKLFHSSQQTAIQNQNVALTGNNSVEQSVNWYLDKHKDFGGCYYIGYLTSGVSPKALNRNWNLSDIRKKYKFISMSPIKVSGHTASTLFDIDDIEYTSDTYGLNFNISSFRDFTDWIVINKNQLAQGIKYQFQANMLKMMKTSNQNNNVEVNIKENALRELDGILTENDNVYSQGILRKLENEAKKVRDQFINKEQSITIENSI